MQLTAGNDTFDAEPAFSPDGTKIAFERFTATTDSQIWIMNADGTGQTQLTVPGPNGDHAHSPPFSPDGTKIVFSRFDDSATLGTHVIATIAPNGTGLVNLTNVADGHRLPAVVLPERDEDHLRAGRRDHQHERRRQWRHAADDAASRRR